VNAESVGAPRRSATVWHSRAVAIVVASCSSLAPAMSETSMSDTHCRILTVPSSITASCTDDTCRGSPTAAELVARSTRNDSAG